MGSEGKSTNLSASQFLFIIVIIIFLLSVRFDYD